MSNLICFGDTVYIEFDSLILFANEVYNPTLHLISTNNLPKISFRNGLFKIFPNFSYKDSHQVEQLKDQLELLKSLNPSETFAAQQLEKDIQREKKTLEDREDKLEDLNQKMYEESKGHPILYGQKLQLLHVESKCFITLSESFNPEGNTINLELTNDGSKNLYFTFMPKFSFNQEGQGIEYDTPIKLISCKSDTFLTKGLEVDLTKIQTIINPETNKFTNTETDFPKILPRRKEPLFQAEKVFQTGMSMKEVPENILVRKFISIKDEEKANAEKVLKNGDYIRLSNDKHFLTMYQVRNPATQVSMDFQSFRGNYDYKYNNVFTLFQILEVEDPKASEGANTSSTLPEGRILEHDETKRYTLKHVVSGKYLALKANETTLTLIEPSEAKGEEIIRLNRRGNSNLFDKKIDRNSIFQLNFFQEQAQEPKFLSVGEGIKIPNQQLDKNTLVFFGFENHQNYLNKWLRPERFNVSLLPIADEAFSSFKLLKVTENDMASFLLIEAFVNQLQKFYDLFNDFINEPAQETPATPSRTMKELNDAIKKLDAICLKFIPEMYENEYNEENEEILVADTLRQHLLREFRGLDIMYIILNHFGSSHKLLAPFNEKIKKLKEKVAASAPVENKEEKKEEVVEEKKEEKKEGVEGTAETKKEENQQSSEEKQETKEKEEKEKEKETKEEEDTIVMNKNTEKELTFKVEPEVEKSIDEMFEFNFSSFLQLIVRFKKIILTSFKKNDLNHYYCSQFVRIPIRCIVMQDKTIFSLASYNEQLIIYELALNLAKEGLWDLDLDALGQLNFYDTHLFTCMENQKDFHTVFMRLLTHSSNSKAPNLQNKARNNFVFTFLSKAENLTHLCPKILEEEGKVYLSFTRKKEPEKPTKLCIDELNQDSSPKALKSNQLFSQNEDLLIYFQKVLELICAVSSVKSNAFDLKIIRYYTYPTLTKLLNILKLTPQYREIRIVISDLISLIHQKYFDAPFVKLPKQLQILGLEENAKEIHETIQKSTKTIISDTEMNYIKDEQMEDIINDLKSIVNSEEQTTEMLKLIEANPNIDKPELARIILDGIKKIYESPVDLPFDFLKKSREVVISFINQATQKNNKHYFDFIKYALDVFKHMETKTLVFAATEITEVLKNKYLYSSKSTSKSRFKSKQNSMNSSFREYQSHSEEFFEDDQRENVKLTSSKIAPEQKNNKELTSRQKSNDILLAGVVDNLARKWKTGERFFFGNDNKIQQFTQIDTINKKLNTSESLNILFDIVSLKQDHLLHDVLLQLRKTSSFETSLYRELDKLIILQDDESIKKINVVIQITFRLTEISREINFAKDNLLTIEEPRWKEIIGEIYEHHWKLFFIIYDTSKHFRYEDVTIESDQRFREAFEKTKIIRWDYILKLVPEGINKPFQKIFNILKTFEVVINTQLWLLEKTQAFTEEYYVNMKALRLNFLILTAFVYRNKENQMMFSKEKGIIRQFYNQHFMNQSSDAMFIFAEILRDNKKLLKLPVKYQYDITMSSYVGTIGRKVGNASTNGYLAATLVAYHFLSRALIPIELFNPLNDMKTKWVQIADVTSFTKFNLLEYAEENLPYGYFEVRETMNSFLENFEHLASTPKSLNEIQSFLTFNNWIEFFPSPNYFLQFELKKYLTKCLVKIYYASENKIKLLENSQNCLSFISCLFAELIFFAEYMNEKKEQNNKDLTKLTEANNFITKHEKYKAVKELYQKAKQTVNLEEKKIRIYLEDISLHNLLREYIFEGCLDLFFDILLKEVDFCKEIHDIHGHTKSVIDFAIEVISQLMKHQSDDEYFPFNKFEKFLNKASAIKGYFSYRTKIIDITNQFYTKVQPKSTLTEKLVKAKTLRKHVASAADNFAKYINPLVNMKKENKEQNMKQVAEHIAEHPKAKEILKEILKYFRRDVNKLDSEEIIFILRLLRKCIEIENSNNPGDEPLYMWKEIAHSDLKKIEKIQSLYRELGLSEILYSFFTTIDQKIFRETVLLSLAYMYGGNRNVQQDFYENFKEDDDNKVLAQIGIQMKKCFESFRTSETKRVNVLYNATQKALFDYFKGKIIETDVDVEELQMKINKIHIDPGYLVHADKHQENELFILILSFLQYLCEGQYQGMQLYLKEQKIDDRVHPKSFDFLSFLRHSMNSFHKIMSRYNLSVGIKIMDVITELVQGEVHENITVFLHKTFLYDLCKILTDYNTRYHTLPRGFGLNIFHETFKEFKSKIIFLFKTMLENKNEQNTKILTEHLDKFGLMKALEDLMLEFIKRNNLHHKISNLGRFIYSLNNEDFKDTLGDAINIYIIFRYIFSDPNEFNDRMRELIKKMDKDNQDLLDKIIFTIFRKLVKSIEIVVETKAQSLMKIWFPVIAVCHYLTEDTQSQFAKHVDRSNSQTKISGLMNSAQEFLPQMDADYQARNRILGFNLLNVYYFLRLLSNLLAIVITVINIATYKYESNGTAQDDRYSRATLAMNIAQIGIASILVLLWVSLLRKRNQTIEWERYVDQNIKRDGFLPPSLKNKLENGDFKDLTKEECLQILMLKGANSEEFKEMQRDSINFKQIALKYYIRQAYFTVASIAFFWHVCYVGITIASLFHPLAAIFQIMDIAFRVDTIKQIYSSISRNGIQFLWTLFLLVLTNIIYSFIGFFFMNDKFTSGTDVLCETAFSCFLNVLNLGLRSGGGIADIIGPQPYLSDDVGLFFIRVVYDLSFFIIMIILLLNLIFGMIIDAFGDLRDQKTSNEEDEKNVCFICGIERSEFEKHMNFEEHILEEHNIWSYVYYITYILEKQKNSKNEMTDIENYVAAKYLISSYEWIPIAKSLTLEQIYQREQVKKEDGFESLQKKLDGIQNNVKDLKTGLQGNMKEMKTDIQSEIKIIKTQIENLKKSSK